MAANDLSHVLQHIRRRTGLQQTSSLTDVELLEQFARDRDESSFTALVHRHGGTVFAACKRVLKNEHDAEDAFQATFLVLASKAGSLGNVKLLGSWLYAVAYRVAMRARTRMDRRCAVGRRLAEGRQEPEGAAVGDFELPAIVDEEVSHLPEKYRSLVVLCYFEGKPCEEIARLLSQPLGTVHGRLSRARDMLRTRLTRRGLALSSASLATALAQEAASAQVPTALVEATVKAAILWTAGEAVAGCASGLLAESILRTMFWKHVLRSVGLVLAIAGLVGAAGYGGIAAVLARNQPPAVAGPSAPETVVAAARGLVPEQHPEFAAAHESLQKMRAVHAELLQSARELDSTQQPELKKLMFDFADDRRRWAEQRARAEDCFARALQACQDGDGEEAATWFVEARMIGNLCRKDFSGARDIYAGWLRDGKARPTQP